MTGILAWIKDMAPEPVPGPWGVTIAYSRADIFTFVVIFCHGRHKERTRNDRYKESDDNQRPYFSPGRGRSGCFCHGNFTSPVRSGSDKVIGPAGYEGQDIGKKPGWIFLSGPTGQVGLMGRSPGYGLYPSGEGFRM